MLGRPSVQIFLPGFIIWVAAVLFQTGFYTFFATVNSLSKYIGSPGAHATPVQESPSQFSLGITVSNYKEYDESTVRDSLPRRILRSVSSRSQLEVPKPVLRQPSTECFDNWDTSTVGVRERQVVAETLRDLEDGAVNQSKDREYLQELYFPRPPTNLSYNSSSRNSATMSPEPIRPCDMKVRLAFRDSTVRRTSQPTSGPTSSEFIEEFSDIPRQDSPPIPDYHITPGFSFGTGGTFKGRRPS